MQSISILGIPNDEHSSSLRGSAAGPAAIRKELHCDLYSSWSECGINLAEEGRLVDLGDVAFSKGTDAWDVIDRGVSSALSLGRPLISLGGDHAITHPVVRAVRKVYPRLTILHIDAHPDIYENFQDDPRSHTSPFARIMEEQIADRLIQVGLRTINDHHREQFRRYGVEAFPMSDWDRQSWLEITTPVYLSLDIDGIDPAFAPGVAHREPGGPSTRQVIDLIRSVSAPIVAADIVEFNPRCDIGGMTATVAAKLVKEIAGRMVR